MASSSRKNLSKTTAPQLTAALAAADGANVRALRSRNDTEFFFVFQDAAKKALAPARLSPPFREAAASVMSSLPKSSGQTFFRALGTSEEKGKKSSVTLTRHLMVASLGQAEALTEEKARQAGAQAWNKLHAEKCARVTLLADSLSGVKGLQMQLTPLKVLSAFLEGLLLSAYEFKKYKTVGNDGGVAQKIPLEVTLLTADKTLFGQLQTEAPRLEAMNEAVQITRDWSNEPSNFGTPEFYAEESRRLARVYGLKCKILTEKDAAREKMGLFLCVGNGSEREGRIVVLEYSPKASKGRAAPKTIALVGKGVTFDSGGISIKPSMRMEEMKHDMTGAATLMGALVLAAKWKVPNRVIAVLAFTENMPSGNAVQPGNVIRSRSGKTVEIFNTDAEGRLVLADVLDYAQDMKPDAVINAATLTGAVSIALGKQCCAIMGNDDSLIDSLRRAGDISGERMWPLPTYDEYFDDLRSDCADMKNVANDGYGGTIRAGIFLKQFIRKGTSWAHLDIAAMAYNCGHFPYFPRRGATGAYVRALARFASEF